ncbi:Kinetochore protein NDC [Ananas comosus]|uniref:Kinetochore protein NDC80 n=1 Tax=Ananas comosus TaxID=4615 RepID=A0A199W7Q1_ANACO|nr:Kinetochore protein NDC [Ananas comosus]
MRGVGGRRRVPRASAAPAPADGGPSLDFEVGGAVGRRDSDASSLCSSRPSFSSAAAANPPLLSDRSSQSAALRAVNSYLSSQSAPFSLRPPLPSARDISDALRFLLARLDFPLPDAPGSSRALDDDVLLLLRLLGCPFKLSRSALKAPGTPHSWPPLLSALLWLTQLARLSDHLSQTPNNYAPSSSSSSSSSPNNFLLFVAHSYSLFLLGDDDAAADLDDEYRAKTRAHVAAAAAAANALEREAADLDARLRALSAGPSRRQAAEAERALLAEDAEKFRAVVDSWGGKVAALEAALADWEKELEAKEREGGRIAGENAELRRRVDAQAVNVRDVERMRRELQAVEQDVAEAESRRNALEEKAWELEASSARKMGELEVLAEECNQALRKLKLGVDFQYVLNAKGSSPAEVIGINYKTVLKPALSALAEDTKKLSVSKLEESIARQQQSRENTKILEEKKVRLAALQSKIDEIESHLSSRKNEMEDHASRCAAEAERMKEEISKKENQLNIVEKEAEVFLKSSEQKLQDAVRESDEETQLCARELLALIDAVSEYKEFMESTLSGIKSDLSEVANDVASLSSKLVSCGSNLGSSGLKSVC